MLEKRTLHNRVATIGNAPYYDLSDEQWQCVKITKEGWEVTENPGIFRRISTDKTQIIPLGTTNNTSRYIKQHIFDNSTIKTDYQKLIAEVYVISLFIPDIAHPMIIPIGPKGREYMSLNNRNCQCLAASSVLLLHLGF